MYKSLTFPKYVSRVWYTIKNTKISKLLTSQNGIEIPTNLNFVCSRLSIIKIWPTLNDKTCALKRYKILLTQVSLFALKIKQTGGIPSWTQ
jgi:hypothetical protein